MLPPLRFVPTLKARSWGGSRLQHYGKPAIPGARLSETWEVADLPDSIDGGQSIVDGGAFAGLSLRAVRNAHRADLLGIATAADDGAFPILVKYLDAAENLSMQVHPDANYVRAHPTTHLKTEAWIIVECDVGARVYRGIRPSTTSAAFYAALAAGNVLEHIECLEVSPGDCVYLPSGTCHALGGGILAAEVQTPSDTTFRVWDWDRNDPSRPLHLEQAKQCTKFGADQNDGVAGFVRAQDAPSFEVDGITTRRLCRSKFFAVEWLQTRNASSIAIDATGIPEVWMTTAGRAQWKTTSGVVDAPKGVSILRPAAVEPGEIVLDAGTTLLRFICASPLDRALA